MRLGDILSFFFHFTFLVSHRSPLFQQAVVFSTSNL
jgi:hypothetical protein